MPHQVILRTSDCRPYSTHDLLKSDFRYKFLVFTGDVKDFTQRKVVETLSDDLSSWFAEANGSSTNGNMIQVYTIM